MRDRANRAGALSSAIASAVQRKIADAPVQRRADAGLGVLESADPVQLASLERSLQLIGDAVQRSESVHQAAAHGISGSGGSLPYLDRIQASFGSHDVSGVQAHVGGAASQACQMMGAQAYATGSSVAFAGSPDLHTAAHEAAHVVQQRGGVQLKGGVGEVGDRYEQHADLVADAVVQGRSAESLLDRYAGGSGGGAVQMRRGRGRGRSDEGPSVEDVIDPSRGNGQLPPTREELDYNASRRDRDPEASTGYVPMTASGWDPQVVLRGLTQVDADSVTTQDGRRCVPTSILSGHIMAGPRVVAAVSENTLDRLRQHLASRRTRRRMTAAIQDEMRVLIDQLAGLGPRLGAGTATYTDLRRLAEAMMLAATPTPSHGMRNEDMEHVVSLGTGGRLTGQTSRFVNSSHTGPADLDGVISSLRAIQGPAHYIVGVDMLRRATGHVNHAVNLGVDESGRVYLYDPWPRAGDQIMYWGSAEAQIRDYFAEGRPWQVRIFIQSPTVQAQSQAQHEDGTEE